MKMQNHRTTQATRIELLGKQVTLFLDFLPFLNNLPINNKTK